MPAIVPSVGEKICSRQVATAPHQVDQSQVAQLDTPYPARLPAKVTINRSADEDTAAPP